MAQSRMMNLMVVLSIFLGLLFNATPRAYANVAVTAAPLTSSAKSSSLLDDVMKHTQPPISTANSTSPATSHGSIGANGLMFIENVGQFDPRARFQVRGSNGSLYLVDNGLWLTVLEHPRVPITPTLMLDPTRWQDVDQPISGVHLKLSFVGANPDPQLEPFNRLDTHVSYFIGNDPTQWRTDVPVWGGVRYIDLYPGIDLEITSDYGQEVQRFVVRDKSQLNNVRLRIEGSDASGFVGSGEQTHLSLATAAGKVNIPLFQVSGSVDNWQASNPAQVGNEISSPFALPTTTIERTTPGMQSMQYHWLSANLTLTNTADLFYSTFLGGGGGDSGYGIAVDAGGATYVVGTTGSTDFPTVPGSFSTSLSGASDVFVTKIASDGSQLIYSTYLGGNGRDEGRGITVDANGSVYVTGYTTSTFPISGALQTNNAGGYADAFVTKLNADGNGLVYSTYLGGSDSDNGYGIAINGTGEAYIVGSTTSATTFPISGALQSNFQGYIDAFVTKLDATGKGPLFSTYLGGSANPYTTSVSTNGFGIAVDATGAAYVTGSTNSSDFPTTGGAFQQSWGGGQCVAITVGTGCRDAFVTKIATTGELVYSTFLGNNNQDDGYGIAVDANGAAHVTGSTNSENFPTTPGAFQPTRSGCIDFYANGWCPDAFVTKLAPDGKSARFSTRLGGDDDDFGYSITMDKDGNAYVTGNTWSVNFPTTSAPLGTVGSDLSNAFVTAFNLAGVPIYSAYLGGTSYDDGNGVAALNNGNIYIVGGTASTTGFPISTTIQSTNGGAYDAFVTKLGLPSVISRTAWTPSCPVCTLYDTQDNLAGPINSASGNYTYQKVDETIPTMAGALKFERSFIGEARNLYTGTLGYGWTHNHIIRLIFPSDPGGVAGQVQLLAPGGSQLPFYDLGNGSYQAYPGVTAQMSLITATGGITTYVVTASNQTVYTFNASGLVTQTVNPTGNVITYTYYPTGSLQAVQSYGRSLRFYYDTQNRLNQVLDPINRSTQFDYDANGDLAVVTDTRGLSWNYQYTGTTHLLTRIIDPDQKTVEHTEYDAQGRAIRQYNGNDELLVQLQFGSDGVITKTDGLSRTSIDRYGRGTWLGGLDAANQVLTRAYDANFKPAYFADANGNGSQLRWNASGSNLEKVLDANGFTTAIQYDTLNNLTQITNTRNFTTSYVYSGTLLTRQTDAVGNTAIYTYGPNNLLIAQQDALGRITQYGYDAFGQRIAITDALTNVTRYAYDGVGRLITTTDALGRMAINAYDSADHLLAVTNDYTFTTAQQNYLNAYNLITQYGYDGFGRQILITDTLGHVSRNGYDAASRLISATADYSPTVGQNYSNTYNLITQYGYDGAGNQILVTDTLQHVTKTDYDKLNRPITVTTNYKDGVFDPSKPDEDVMRVTVYDPAGNVTDQTDALGRVTHTWYDNLNRVISTSANYSATVGQNYLNTYNLIIQYNYDEAGNQILVTDTVGHVTRRYYDPLNRIISTTVNYSPTLGVNAQNQYNLITRNSYDPVGNRMVVTDALNNVTRYAYDPLNRLITTTNALTGTTIIVYDPVGNRIKSIDALTHTTVYTYNAANRLVAQADPIGNVMKYEYDPLGRTVVVTDALTHTSRTFYDAAGRVFSMTNALSGTTVITYDALGRRVGFVNENGKSSYSLYDGLGRTIAITDATGIPLYTAYDVLGNRIKSIDALGHTTVFTYDTDNRLIAQADALGNTTRYQYDPLGNRQVMTDPNGIATGYGYDALNRLKIVTESLTTTAGLNPNSNNLTTTYQYDPIGNRTVMTNARGYTTTYAYDAMYRLTALSDPLSHTTRYGYDLLGNRLVMTDANIQTTFYVYDALNRLLVMTYTADALTVKYAYDTVGNRSVMTDSLGVTRYTYDALNRPIVIADPYSGTVTYTYDLAGNRIKLNYPDGKTITYTYDAANRMTSVVDWAGQSTQYAYDSVGRLVTVTLPNALRTLYVYDDANRLVRLSHIRTGDSSSLGDYQYLLDGLGNRLVVTESLAMPNSGGMQVGALPGMTADQVAMLVTGHRPPGLSALPVAAEAIPISLVTAESTLRVTSDSTIALPTRAMHLLPNEPLTSTTVYSESLDTGQVTIQAESSGMLTSTDWLNSVQTAIRQSEYDISWQAHTYLPDLPAAYEAANRAQDIRTYFAPTGIRLIRRTEINPSWEWGLRLIGYGYTGTLQAVSPLAATDLSTTQNSITYPRGALTEWYINDERGLEQGFTLVSPPSVGASGSLVVDMELSGNLSAAMGTVELTSTQPITSGGGVMFTFGVDPSAIDFTTSGGVRVLHYGDLRAYDVTSRALPARMELTSSGLRLIVDDSAAVYPITIDPLLTSPSWTAESDQASAHFGVALRTAGDVNGDGYADVIVGAREYDNGQTDEGRAFVYYGSTSGLTTTASWTTESNQASSRLGASVGTAGDVNGDGYSDVIVGAFYYDNGQTDEGRAFIYYGSTSGLSSTASWTAESDQASARFGVSVGTAGDVNGDGYSDVIVGADSYDNGQTDEGRAFIYYGSASVMSTTASWIAESDQATSDYGSSVGTAGDVNGDGYSDVIVGSSNFDNGQTDEGRAFVYYGSASAMSSTASWTAESDQASAHYGISVATAGDVNGDGYADVIVGAREYDNGQTDEGRVFVYHGSASGLNATANWTAESDQAGAWFGVAVGTAGDVNGDGYADVIIGAIYYDNGQSDEGRAFVYNGSAASLNTTSSWTAESDQASAHFGVAVGTAGDVNGDGYADVIVGAREYDNGQTDEGRVFVYNGSTSGLSTTASWTAESDQATAYFGGSVATAGDVNGDGYADVIVGADSYDNGQTDEGRTFVYYGSTSGLSTTASWTAESNQASARFGDSVGTAGDVNGDGYSDVVVGAYYYDNGQTDEGRAYIYYGSTSGVSTTVSWTAESDQASARFGVAVGTAGDVNGDGYSDVIVGADSYDNGQTDEGRAFIYYGSATVMSTTASWTVESDQASSDYGSSVGTAGDVNGDGYADVIVGSSNYDNGQTDEGRAFVYFGSASAMTSTASWIAESDQASARFGTSVGTAGDVNGDGYADVIIGAREYDNGQTDEGRAFVYHGSASGLNATANWTAESDQASAWFGVAVGTAGDVNGDGYADVIIGAIYFDNGQSDEGRTFQYYGNAGAGLTLRPRQMRTDGSVHIAPLGKSDSATSAQLRMTGRMPLGRSKVKLQWQVAPLGMPFTATTIISGTSSAWTDILTAGVVITQNVAGLTEGTPYHWRARLVYRPGNPIGQSASRWIHIPWNGWNEQDFRTPLMTTTMTVIRYVYDPFSRLMSANYSGDYNYTFAYAYDKVGDRTAQTSTITTTIVTTYTYDAANRLTTVGGINYTWDNNGNLTNDGSTLYRYDQANRMVSTTLSGATTLFNYNGDGVRLKQVIAGVPTTYTQDLAAPLPVVLQAKTGTIATQYLFSLGTRPIVQYTSSAWQYLLPDALGSVRQIADASGNISLTESYQPYGALLNSSGSATSMFGYSGEQADTSGLIYLRARYLNPTLGIFTSRDPWSGDWMRPGSMNGFGYVEENPINQVDPRGQYPYQENCDELGWPKGYLARTLYCDPIVAGSIEADLSLAIWMARAMPLVGWRHGADNLNHYIWGDGTPKTYSAQWYLSQTPYNEEKRRAMLFTILNNMNIAHIFPNIQFPKTLGVEFDADGDVKATLGRHNIYGLVIQSNSSDSICQDKPFYVQFYIDDPYDFEPTDPKNPSRPQYLGTDALGSLGFGKTPFEWMKELALRGKATEFRTKVYWAMRIDYSNLTTTTIWDVDFTKPGNPHVDAIP